MGTQKRAAQFIDTVEGKGKGGWAKGLADETRHQGKPLQPMKKGINERMNGLGTKATRLTSHLTAMHFTIQSLGNRMVPRQRLGQTGQFHCAASPEERGQTRLWKGKVPHGFEEVQQNQKGHNHQHELCQRLHHSD